MIYIAVFITVPPIGDGYQEILDDVVQRVTDVDGNTVEPIEYAVTDPSPEPPAWGH